MGRATSLITLGVAAVVVGGCGSSAHHAAAPPIARPRAVAVASTPVPVTAVPTTVASTTTTTVRAQPQVTALPAAVNGGPGTFAPTGSGVLDGKTVAIDPGHNGGNFSASSTINQLIFNGRESEACDTSGTETDGGYTEAQFNWNVAQVVTADLRAEGATVVLTRTSDTGVGPCVTQRAAIGNQAHADAALSIHADGGPVDGRGYAILEPVADGPNDAVIAPSDQLAVALRNTFGAVTGEPLSTYDGVDGLQPRDDLGGTNLSTVPKVFIECANMRNPVDAQLVVTTSWQDLAGRAIAQGLTTFLATG